MKCIKCESEEFRKHGKRKIGEKEIQRYKCKNCKKTVSEHDTIYTITEKRLLSFLVNFLENDLKNIDLKEFLSKSKEYRPGIADIEIKQCRKPECFEFGSKGTSIPVSYTNPRLIICENGGNIKLIKIPKEIAEKCKNGFTLTLR